MLTRSIPFSAEAGLLNGSTTQVRSSITQKSLPRYTVLLCSQFLSMAQSPLSFLRERLSKMRFIPSDVLAGFANGQLARGYGIVTVRQRPGTAKGVVFITLEDDAGTVNVICWPTLVEQFRREVMGAQLLGVYGMWQSENNVRHLVAKRLVDLSHLLGELETRSRDFQ